MMKNSTRSLLVFALAALVIAGSGCKKKPYGVTPLRGPNGAVIGDTRANPIGDPGAGRLSQGDFAGSTPIAANADGSIPLPTLADFESKFNQDPAPLKAQTVLFKYDSSAIDKTEVDKLKAVTDYLGSNPRNALLVEGHCDERGTEEYNRSLGERRALAVREFLANSGVNPARVITRSFGEDRPVELGHDEAAWSRNRRGDFIVLIPK
jgi:peptidoglycan-associated lipoprotein